MGLGIEGAVLDGKPTEFASTESSVATIGAKGPPSGIESDRRIGSYRIIRELGRGGMGAVFEAEREWPRRRVALKVIRSDRFVDERQIQLFQREVNALARLKHPNIAAIYEAGRTEDGQYFFAMELVRGVTLDRYLAKRPPAAAPGELAHRLRVFAAVCAAVHYAHQRGVIHRDLKPSNIIVDDDPNNSTNEALPDIKVLDFGVARIIDPDSASSTLATQTGQIMGTPAYMSPEQARGDITAIDIRTDVYALGVASYEMLTGRRPHDLSGASLIEALRIVCEEDVKPLRESWKGPRLDADVETIVHKAIAKEPDLRYASAAALAEDVERYLTSQPILARAPSTAYQMRKLVARHKIGFGLATSLVLLIAAFGVWMSVLYTRAIRAEAQTATEAATAEQVSEFMVGLFNVSDPSEARGSTVTAREILEKGSAKIERELGDQPQVQARLMNTMGRVYASLGLHAQAEPLLERALAIQEQQLGEDHETVAAALTDLGWLLQRQGRLEEARRHHERALSIRQERFGPEHWETAWSLYYLANLHAMAGEFAKAWTYYERVLPIFEDQLGPDDQSVIWCLNDMANILALDGNFAAARDVTERVLRIRERVLGPDHPDVASGMSNLGTILTWLGELDEAEPLLRNALATKEKVFGTDHYAVANALESLGALLQRQGKPREALPYLRRARKIMEASLEAEHPELARALNTLALAYRDVGELGEAEAHFRQALTIREHVLDPDSLDIAESLEGYAALLREVSRDQEAEKLESRARAIRAANAAGRSRLPPDALPRQDPE